MVLSHSTSDRAGIGFLPQLTVKSYETDFRAGRRSQLQLWLSEKEEEKPPLAHPGLALGQISAYPNNAVLVYSNI
jgi:hypothetical protein